MSVDVGCADCSAGVQGEIAAENCNVAINGYGLTETIIDDMIVWNNRRLLDAFTFIKHPAGVGVER